jgi:hypothetical protein
LDEVQIPGVRVREELRLPTRLADQTRGLDLRRNAVAVVLARTTADFPYRAGNNITDAQRQQTTEAVDPESGIRRIVTLPVGRSFAIGGWGSVAPSAPDHLIDALARMPPAWRFDGSSRFEGVPSHRASSAFDGDPRTAWIADAGRGARPWLSWSGPRALRIDRFRLLPAGPAYASPTVVRVVAPRSQPQVLPVRPNGVVALRDPVVTRSLRLDVVQRRTPPGPEAGRLLAAVGIAEVRVPGLRPPHPLRSGGFRTTCGAMRALAGRGAATLSLTGRIQDLDAGRPLALRGCGRASALPLAAGSTLVDVPAGSVFRADYLRFASGAPLASAAPAGAQAGRVTSQGTSGNGSHTGARLVVRRPGWLVLGESYSLGWRAYCTDAAGKERDLGAPVPIDGFANGWRVLPGCSHARFAFAPQRLADASYIVSLVAFIALLAIIVWVAVRMRRRRTPPLSVPDSARLAWGALGVTPVRRFPFRIAIPLAVAIAAVAGIVFAWRAGAVIGLVAAVLLVLGVSVGRLLALAVVGLIVLPVLYVVKPFSDVSPTNFANFTYAQYYIGAHWVAVGVVSALIGALVLWLVELRAASRPDQPPPMPASGP